MRFAYILAKPRSNVFGFETEGSLPTRVSDVTVYIDNEQSFGPSRISLVYRVGHFIDQARHGQFERFGTARGDLLAPSQCRGLRKNNAVAAVIVHLPFVVRVSFLDVNK